MGKTMTMGMGTRVMVELGRLQVLKRWFGKASLEEGHLSNDLGDGRSEALWTAGLWPQSLKTQASVRTQKGLLTPRQQEGKGKISSRRTNRVRSSRSTG